MKNICSNCMTKPPCGGGGGEGVREWEECQGMLGAGGRVAGQSIER